MLKIRRIRLRESNNNPLFEISFGLILGTTNIEIKKSEPNDFVTSMVKSGMNLEEVKGSIETSAIGIENEFSDFLEEKISSHDMSIYDIIVSIFFGIICAIGLINSILILNETITF